MLIVIGILIVLCLVLLSAFVHQYYKVISINKKKDQDLLVDLELSTVDQLLEELRKRPLVPYILVRPFPDGLVMEAHNIHPMITAQIMSVATYNLVEDLRAKGFQINDDNDGYDGWLQPENQ